jgi:pantoate--beta-alanine ligase
VSVVVAQTREELASARAKLSARVAVVMTMGALHAGHVELMRRAHDLAGAVMVTIFLNPLQFGANEDLDKYPARLEADLGLCEAEGVDLVFAPTNDIVYPNGSPDIRVAAGALGNQLEGEHRPGHFDGVLTVVAKLLHLTTPDVALFGEKDAQQLALIRHMVRDLDFPVEIVSVPTIREEGGLALSSRNTYLAEGDLVAARSLNKALQAGLSAAGEGAAETLAAASAVLAAEPGASVDYLALVDDETWAPASSTTHKARLLVAARIGTTRLIDNVALTLANPGERTTSAPERAEG